MTDEPTIEALVPAPPIANPLSIQRAPDMVLEEATRAAKALKDVIDSKPKKVVFGGKTYLQFEDWQTIARFYGVTAVGRSTKFVEFDDGKVKGFEASADALLVATNTVISSADAMCLSDEPNWERKPLYQLRSMSQTRACAKALRNVLAWVVVLAGYQPTPAEEMNGVEERKPMPRPPAKKPPEAAKTEAKKPATWRVRFWAKAISTGHARAEIEDYVKGKGFTSTHDVPDEREPEFMAWAEADAQIVEWEEVS